MVLAINIRILLGPELGRSKPGQVKSQIEPVQIGHGSLVEHGQIIRSPVPIDSRVIEFLEMAIDVDIGILFALERRRIKATYGLTSTVVCWGGTGERGEIRYAALVDRPAKDLFKMVIAIQISVLPGPVLRGIEPNQGHDVTRKRRSASYRCKIKNVPEVSPVGEFNNVAVLGNVGVIFGAKFGGIETNQRSFLILQHKRSAGQIGQVISAPVPIGSRVVEFLHMIGGIDMGILFAPELRTIIAHNSSVLGKRRGARESGEIGIVPAVWLLVEFFEVEAGNDRRIPGGIGILFAPKLWAVIASWHYSCIGSGSW